VSKRARVTPYGCHDGRGERYPGAKCNTVRVQAELSLYPLRTEKLSEPLRAFWEALRRDGVEMEAGVMSTRIAGECEHVFAAIREGFECTAGQHEVVMVLKVSNACPENRAEEKA
jgi:uncharacterized protein YqgV (UPF0045/DUF77 family)